MATWKRLTDIEKSRIEIDFGHDCIHVFERKWDRDTL